MGKYTQRWFIPVPADGEEANYDGVTGPISVDPDTAGANPAANWGDTIQTVAYRLDSMSIGFGELSNRPDPGPTGAPKFYVSTDTDSEALFVNDGGTWSTVASGTGSGSGSGVTTTQFNNHISDYQALASDVSDLQDAVTSLQGDVGTVDTELSSIQNELDSITSDLNAGAELFDGDTEPTAANDGVVDGDLWLDTSADVPVWKRYDGPTSTWVLVGGASTGGGGTGEPPTASFTYSPTTIDTTTTVSFDASGSTDPDDTIDLYEWDWQNNGTFDATGVTQSHTFPVNGTYTVVLRVTDAAGNTDTATTSITVSDTSISTLDSWEHQNHEAYYSEINNVDDWQYVADAVDGSVSVECTTGNSRYMITYPGDGLGTFTPGESARLWVKVMGSRGVAALRFAASPDQTAVDKSHYDVFLNNDLNKFLLYRQDGSSVVRIGGVDDVTINQDTWYGLEVDYFPQGGNSLPIRWLDSNENVIAEDLSAADDTGQSLLTDSNQGVGIRSNLANNRFDYLQIAENGF